MVVWDKWKAMGSDVTITIVASDHINAENEIEISKKEITYFEKRFSRFLSSSELSKINNSGGKEIPTSPEMIDLLKKTREMHAKTSGVFDPTVLDTLISYGYDRSLDFDSGVKVAGAGHTEDEIKNKFLSRTKFDELVIDEKNSTLHIPVGLKIDLGGIGKGYIADRVADRLSKKYKDFWISAGGDMYLSGKNEGGSSWEVPLQNPLEPKTTLSSIGSILILDPKMCIANSGVIKRKGTSGNMEWNHIINPKTGLSVKNDMLAATVIAKSVCDADVFAKAALILGKKDGIELINKIADTECIMIDKNMDIVFSDGIKKYLKK